MQRVCAWCRAELGEVESEVQSDLAVTHGICPACAARVRSEVSEPLQDFLERLGVPVILLNAEIQSMAANSMAQKLLGKELSGADARMLGEVIECTHASEPDGCGNTTHCTTCTIRKTVLETYETGKSCLHVKAFPDVQIGQDNKTLSVEISTEKVADLVLLRIDDYSETS
jgi:hypothetical protein